MGFLNLLFILAIVVVGGAIGMAMSRTRMQKMAASNKVFLEKYPGAAKVYPYSRASITSEAVQVYSVDGDLPEFFYETGNANGIAALIKTAISSISGGSNTSGFYLKPGTNTVEMSYYHNRPGFFYKNVTTTTDAVKRELNVEANKTYRLSFDRKENTFTLEEAGN
jgi:hypothetical protein